MFFEYLISKAPVYILQIRDKSNINIIKNFYYLYHKEIYLKLDFPKESFEISAMLHPVSYLNKILFGSKQGTMQLWNIKSSQLIYSYKPFDAGITVLKQARNKKIIIFRKILVSDHHKK